MRSTIDRAGGSMASQGAIGAYSEGLPLLAKICRLADALNPATAYAATMFRPCEARQRFGFPLGQHSTKLAYGPPAAALRSTNAETKRRRYRQAQGQAQACG